MIKQRTEYFDFLRGIAILMVVAIHTFPNVEFQGLTNTIQIFVRQIIGCPVPIFLAISGYFLGRKELETKEQQYSFWKKQIPKVYIPALVWSLPLFVLSLKRGDNHLISVANFFLMGFSIYYFIALIIQCYFLLPVLQKNTVSYKGWIITCLSIVCGIIISWFYANRLPLIIHAGPFFTWLMFFYIGLCLGRNKDKTYQCKYLYIGLFLSLGLMMLEAWGLNMYGRNGYGLKASVYIYSAVVIFLLFSRKFQTSYNNRCLLNNIISYIGRISFGIYLTHCYWIMITGKYIVEQPWIIKWFVVSLLSILSIMIARSVFNDKILKFVGFR